MDHEDKKAEWLCDLIDEQARAMSGLQFKVAIALFRLAEGAHHEAQASHSQIAAMAGCTRRSAISAIQAIEKSGWLTVIRAGNRYTPNTYRLGKPTSLG